jgi:hypothetical protein
LPRSSTTPPRTAPMFMGPISFINDIAGVTMKSHFCSRLILFFCVGVFCTTSFVGVLAWYTHHRFCEEPVGRRTVLPPPHPNERRLDWGGNRLYWSESINPHLARAVEECLVVARYFTEDTNHVCWLKYYEGSYHLQMWATAVDGDTSIQPCWQELAQRLAKEVMGDRPFTLDLCDSDGRSVQMVTP